MMSNFRLLMGGSKAIDSLANTDFYCRGNEVLANRELSLVNQSIASAWLVDEMSRSSRGVIERCCIFARSSWNPYLKLFILALCILPFPSCQIFETRSCKIGLVCSRTLSPSIELIFVAGCPIDQCHASRYNSNHLFRSYRR